jgi:hypothetical protein
MCCERLLQALHAGCLRVWLLCASSVSVGASVSGAASAGLLGGGKALMVAQGGSCQVWVLCFTDSFLLCSCCCTCCGQYLGGVFLMGLIREYLCVRCGGIVGMALLARLVCF